MPNYYARWWEDRGYLVKVVPWQKSRYKKPFNLDRYNEFRKNYPFFVEVHDYEIFKDGYERIYMKKVKGIDFLDWLSDAPIKDIIDMYKLGHSWLSSIYEVEEPNIWYHWDLRPRNIMMTDDGPIVIDPDSFVLTDRNDFLDNIRFGNQKWNYQVYIDRGLYFYDVEYIDSKKQFMG